MLFVPGDSERKQQKALDSSADALILDLEDSVAEANLPTARRMAQAFLQAQADRSRRQVWVRVNFLGGGRLLDDLVAVLPGRPDAIVVPKVTRPAELTEIGNYLAALEVHAGLEPGSTKLVALAAETPESLFHMAAYAGCTPRLAGITWGAEDFLVSLGGLDKFREDGSFTAPFALAKSMVLLAAKSAGVQPIDTVYANFRDLEGLAKQAREARRDGYLGKIAIHPDQIPPINEAFTPTAAEVAKARKIVAAFAANPGAGVLGVDGQMLDRPHLLQAQAILDLAARAG